MTALSDLLTSANTESWPARAIARKARASGHSLGHDTAARYLRGDHGKPDEATLLAFSAVFPKLTLVKLRRAAALSEEVTEIRLPPEAARLTRRQWAAVREVIMAMVDHQAEASEPAHMAETPRDRERVEADAALREAHMPDSQVGERTTSSPDRYIQDAADQSGG